MPRFQRLEAWDRGRVTSFLNTIINNLPVGVTLALEVAGKEKFISRYVSTAQPAIVGAVTQHLLDGQQRLTAFWRSMHNNYDWETYFIHFPEFDRTRNVANETTIRCEARWVNKKTGLTMPRWAEDPLDYLQGRVEWADASAIATRLKSHLISFDLLSKAQYADLDGAALKEKLTKDFDDFMRDRAGLVVTAMEFLTSGGSPSIEALQQRISTKESVDA